MTNWMHFILLGTRISSKFFIKYQKSKELAYYLKKSYGEYNIRSSFNPIPLLPSFYGVWNHTQTGDNWTAKLWLMSSNSKPFIFREMLLVVMSC